MMSFACALVATTGCGKLELGIESDSEVMGSGFSQTGIASYYGVGDGFHGRRTANGETFNAYGLSAAHRTLRFGSCLLVTNLYNGKKAKVRVNDRGPFSGGRILDLSYGAAKAVGMISSGTAQVRIEGVSCSASAETASSDAVSGSERTPVTDNTQCKVFLSSTQESENKIALTVQSRVGDTTRPCGKSIKIYASGNAAQAKEIASFEVDAGDGRRTMTVSLGELQGSSHIFAQALNSKQESMGESVAKNLQITAGL